MDLLASYADDTSDNQTLDVNEKAADSGMVFSHLEAEWESFEKMMGDDLLMKSTDKVPSDKTADSVEPDRSVEEHPDPVRLSTGDECNSGQESVSSVNDDRSSSKSSASYDSESDSEENDKEEKEENKSDRKRHSSESSSSSSSSASDVSEASAGKVERAFPNVQAGSEKTSSDRGLSERKVPTRRSRSRSHSLSPSRKRRRSSDRSVHHRSSTRHSHARHEKKRISSRRSRSRSRSRDRHTRRHSSRERRHYSNRDRRHRRSRSRDHHHRHRHHPGSGMRRGSPPHGDRRKPEVDKRRSRSRSSERKEGEMGEKKITPRNFGAGSGGGSEGVVNESGARVTYRTAGIKFGHGPGTGKPQTFKEQMRQNLIKMWSENMASCSSGDPSSGTTNQPNLMQLNPQSVFTNMPIQSAGLGVQALCTITPQMAFMQTVAAMQKKAEEITGITVPKYYNPAAVNPMKYAEQVQKRKLLWSKSKDKKESDNQWHAQALVADGDSKTTAKFRKLMGIKDGETKETVTTTVTSNEDDFIEEQRKKQEELFQQLDKEYHFARIATHTQRGAGLGFGSQSGSFH